MSLGTAAIFAAGACNAERSARTFGLAADGVDQAALDRAEATAATLGKHLDVLTVYDAFARQPPLPTGLFDQIAAKGSLPTVTWEPWDPGRGPTQPLYSSAQIAGGRYDSYLAMWAKQAAGYQNRFQIRFAHEMNGNWYPWAVGQSGSTPEDYVAAYRRAWKIFADAGAGHVQWVWSPNVILDGDADVVSRCYPGDDCVDVIGIDGYNFGDYPGHRWTSPQELFGPTLALADHLAPRKPLWITEVGCSDRGGDKPLWISDLLHYLSTTQVQGLIWFEADKPGEPDWRLTSTPQTTSAAELALRTW
jgi:mannan endo-1,4-beta-mannosidase